MISCLSLACLEGVSEIFSDSALDGSVTLTSLFWIWQHRLTDWSSCRLDLATKLRSRMAADPARDLEFEEVAKDFVDCGFGGLGDVLWREVVTW